MKTFRILPIMIAAVLLFSSCGTRELQNTSVSGNNDITIVTSFYPMYIFTKNIVKDIEGVNVVNMAEPQTGCLHDYNLNPADLKKIEKADIMVINGAGMETFIEKIINNRPQIKIIEASKGLELIKEDGHHDGDEHEHEADNKHEGHDHSVNPHLWVSISGAIDEVKNICDQLKNADANNAKKYQSNTDEYVQKLETQKEKMYNALKDIENRNIVTFNKAFPYLAKEFDLDVVEVIETDEGSSPSAGELSDKIKKIKELNVKALFSDAQVSSNLAQTVSKETGINVYKIDTVVTGSDEIELDYYEKTMDENLNVLLEALK